MGSGAMLYTSSFIKTGSGCRKFMGDTQTHRQQGVLIRVLLFYQSKESRLKITLKFEISFIGKDGI
jgi:hypothetical protein